MHSEFRRALLLTLLFFVSIPFAAEPATYRAYLTNKAINGQPDHSRITEFSCSDRIYLVVESTDLPEGMHELVVKWINPDHEQQELTRYKFKGIPFSRNWAWLQLNGPTGAVLGQVFDPSFGMENFIGTWQAEVSMDNETVQNLEFLVIC